MKNFLVILIKFYQKYISPAKRCNCPFVPSCSNYAVFALKEYGLLKGGFLSVWRILRCNPFNKGSFDPPEHWASKFGFNTIILKNEQV